MAEPVMIEGGSCPFCLQSGGGALRPDKKGRPFFRCAICGTVAFIVSPQAYKMFRFLLQDGASFFAKAAASAGVFAPEKVGAA